MLIQIVDLTVSSNIDIYKQKHQPDYLLVRHPDLSNDEYMALCKALKISSRYLIVHTKLEVAKKLNVHALHMRFKDYQNRGKVYKRISVAVHNFDELKVIEANGDVDYVIISPIFETPSKPGATPKGIDFLKEAKLIYSGKLIALGGIRQNNINQCLKVSDGIASIRYFL